MGYVYLTTKKFIGACLSHNRGIIYQYLSGTSDGNLSDNQGIIDQYLSRTSDVSLFDDLVFINQLA